MSDAKVEERPAQRNGQRPKMLIMVITRDIKDPDKVHKRVINYHNPDGREWLSRHSYWALNNGKTILTGPFVDDKQVEKWDDHDIPDFDEQEG